MTSFCRYFAASQWATVTLAFVLLLSCAMVMADDPECRCPDTIEPYKIEYPTSSLILSFVESSSKYDRPYDPSDFTVHVQSLTSQGDATQDMTYLEASDFGYQFFSLSASNTPSHYMISIQMNRCCPDVPTTISDFLLSKDSIFGTIMIFGGTGIMSVPKFVKIQTSCGADYAMSDQGSMSVCAGPMKRGEVKSTSVSLQVVSPIIVLFVDLNTLNSYNFYVEGHVTNAAKTTELTLDPVPLNDALNGFSVNGLDPGTTYTYTFDLFEKRNPRTKFAFDFTITFTTTGFPTPHMVPSTTSIKVFIPGQDPWSIDYSMKDFSVPSLPFNVYGAQQLHATPEVLLHGAEISSLQPGANYSLEYRIFRETAPNEDFVGQVFMKTLCSCFPGVSDDSPRFDAGPQENAVIQKGGIVYFKFMGYSVCGDSYAFTRQEYDENGTLSVPNVFTSNFQFFQDDNCPTFYDPQDNSVDDLLQSNLKVGGKYRYNIRAVGNNYQGEISWIEHIVSWESSIAGRVGLDETNGNLGVPNVNVSWELHDLEGKMVLHGSEMTGTDGKFSVVINSKLSFENNKVYPMYLSFSKQTLVGDSGFIDHNITCDAGSTLCSKNASVIYLKHLDFKVPFVAVDKTGVPVSGNVFIAKTAYGSTRGCPIFDARVCLIDKTPGFNDDRETLCVNTDAFGNYKIPATVGSTVSIRVSYKNHTFEYVPTGTSRDLSKGFTIQVKNAYDLNDFQDITTTPLSVALAGGLCEYSLGQANLRFQVQGCPWKGDQSVLKGVRSVFSVMPHNLKVSVDSVVSRPDIVLDPLNINLSDMPSMEQQSTISQVSSNENYEEHASLLFEEESQVPELKFHYDGKTSIRVKFDGNENTQCKSIDAEGTSLDNTPIVFASWNLIRMTVFVEKIISPIQTCNIVDPNTKVIIHNNLGLVYGNKDDDDYKALINDPDKVAMLEICNNGCSLTTGQFESPSKVVIEFSTGRPNRDSPYTKSIQISTSEAGFKPLVIQAIVYGQYKISDTDSVALPTYEPLMIIRDPPGGGSSSFYQDVQTTIRLDTASFQEYNGFDVEGKAGIGFKHKDDGCILGLCFTLSDIKIKGGARKKLQNLTLDDYRKEINAKGFTTTWSYATSTNPFLVGEQSDVFVVPNLNVKFSLSDIINWNSSQCRIWKTHNTTFNLVSPQNAPALAFLSVYEIKNTEIKTLEFLKAEAEDEMKKLDNSTKEYAAALANRDAAVDAILGWQTALQNNEKTKAEAMSGSSNLIRVGDWLEKVAAKETMVGLNGTVDTRGMHLNTGLVSTRLASMAKVRPHYAGKTESNLENLNTIKFSGGGSSVTYQLTANQVANHVNQLGGGKENYVKSGRNGGGINGELVVLQILIDLDIYGYNSYSVTRSHQQTDQIDSSTKVGFTLADPNIGDVFDVDVYIDPTYGSFVFSTRGGRSMCPHEKNTTSRVIPRLRQVNQPPRTVLPTDPIVFELEIANEGDYPSAFVLNFDNRYDHSSDLMYSPRLPYTFERINPGESVPISLTVHRGAVAYNHPAPVILLEMGCENGLDTQLDAVGGASMVTVRLSNQIIDDKPRLVYSRTCPKVFLEGEINMFNKFVVTSESNNKGTIPVTIRNPMVSQMKLADATLDPSTRLTSVKLRFRRQGDPNWRFGQRASNGQPIDIDFTEKDLEDMYGFATVNWDISSLHDGYYEMQIQSICAKLDSAPLEFNSYVTQIVNGVISRSPPKAFGRPQPYRQLQIGDPIEMEFDKILDCNTPYSFLIDMVIVENGKKFNNANLLLVCDKRYISVQFDPQNTIFGELIGYNLSMRVSGVSDIDGNQIKKPIDYQAQIVARTGERHPKRRYLAEVQESDFASAEISPQILSRLESSRNYVLDSISKAMEDSAKNTKSVYIPMTITILVASIVFSIWTYSFFRL